MNREHIHPIELLHRALYALTHENMPRAIGNKAEAEFILQHAIEEIREYREMAYQMRKRLQTMTGPEEVEK